MLRNRYFLLGVVVSAVLLFLFFYGTDFGEMWQKLKEAKYVFLIPGVLVYFCGIYFRALRWKFFLKPLGNFSSFRLFPLVVIGFMVNNILPGRLGIIVRAYILGEKENISKMAVGGTMVAEQVFDGIMLLVFAFCCIPFCAQLSSDIRIGVYIAAGLFFAALLLCFMLVLSPKFAKRVISLLILIIWSKKWRGKVEQWLLHLVDGLGFMRSPKQLLITLVLTALIWLCESGLFYMVALSFDIGQPFYKMMLVTSVASLSWSLIFVAPGGLGSFDLACKETMKLFVSNESLVNAYATVLHAVILFPVIALGFIFLWRENFTLAKVKDIGNRRRELK